MSGHRAHVLLQPGYVLHSRAYRDSSLLLELFTPLFGRMGVIARGARQPKSRLHGVLQPFRPLLMSWSGRGELPTLTAAEADGAVPWLAGQSLLAGFYLNELLMRLLHRHDPHPRLYGVYLDTVHILDGLGQAAARDGAMASSALLERALRIFERQLLEGIGYGLVLDHDADQGLPIDAQRSYVYDLLRGPLPMTDGVKSGGLTIRGQSLLDLACGRLVDDVSLRDAKRLTRAALTEQLAGRPLASRRLFVAQHKHAL